MSRPDAEHLRELLAMARRRPHLALSLIMPLGAAAVVSGVLWAHFAAHEMVTRTEGKIIPSPEIENVQAREGGVLRELLVSEGDRVAAGQIVARLEDAGFKAEMQGQRARRLVLSATAARLEAEANGVPLKMPAEVMSLAPQVAAREVALFTARQSELHSAVQILTNELTQRKSDVAILESRERTLSRSMGFASQELQMGRELAAKGLKSKLDLLKLERSVSDLQGEIETIQQRLIAARASVDEAQRRIDERQQAFASQALLDLGKSHADIAAIDASLTTLSERVARQDIRAPRDGIVKKVLAASAGTVIGAGSTIFEESAPGDDLLIEGKVRPADLALLRPGQTASVRIGGGSEAYGMLPATLEQVSQVGRGPNDDPSFVVRLHPPAVLSKAQLGIEPGMQATVDITVGRESVLDYLLAPLRRINPPVVLAQR